MVSVEWLVAGFTRCVRFLIDLERETSPLRHQSNAAAAAAAAAAVLNIFCSSITYLSLFY
jgi:hypothetical protein